MTSTLTPTCSLCGLRFENRPLLDLHLREDHRRRGPTIAPARGTPAGAPPVPPQAGSPAAERSPDSGRRAEAADPDPRPARLAGLRRIAGVFRRANAELLLAWELMVRPIGQPRSAPPTATRAEPDARPVTARRRIRRAA